MWYVWDDLEFGIYFGMDFEGLVYVGVVVIFKILKGLKLVFKLIYVFL